MTVLTPSPKKTSERLRKLSETPWYVKMLIYGRSGAGKTYLACTAEKPLVVLSEYNVSIPTLLALHRETGADPDIFEVTSWNDYMDAYKYAAANLSKYKTIVIDGITDLNYRVMREILDTGIAHKAEHDQDILEIGEYNKLHQRTMYAVKLFRDLPIDVVFTALEQDIKKEMITVPMITPKSTALLLPSQFNTVGNLIVKPKGNNNVRELQVHAQLTKEGKNPGGALSQVITSPNLATLIPEARKALQTMAQSSTPEAAAGVSAVTPCDTPCKAF